MATVKIRGIRAITRAFKALPDIARAEYGAASSATAARIKAGASRRVRRRYGFLARQIGYTYNKKTGRARVGILKGSFAIGTSALTSKGAELIRPTSYGHLIEFGHGGPHPAPAFPFMRPAAAAERSGFESDMRRATKQVEKMLSDIGKGDD